MVLTLFGFVTPAIGDEGVDFDAVLETLKSDRGKLEEMRRDSVGTQIFSRREGL